MSKNNMDNEMLRSQINDIIEGEIQNGINDYLEEKENKKESKGFGGEVPQDEGSELNVRISKNEVDKIMKEYKRIKRQERSNLGQVQKLGLVDKDGRPLDG
jgi:hypothetical protein|tara:strand:- start:187 stop:489 length:303 start_codon:yes stop_codon:yes gene_type:complete